MPSTGLRKVLIITYYWPPSGGAGVQRWLKFAKYLPEFGWQPIIYTPENPESPVIDYSLEKDIHPETIILKSKVWEPYQFYKRFVGLKKSDKINAGFLSEKKKPGILENMAIWIRGNLFIPDARKYWIKPSIRYLQDYLINNPVDAIISTGPPHSMHIIGYHLHLKTRIPWIADFRDPWTQIDFYDQLKLTGWADKKHQLLEKRILETATRIIVISKGMERDFRKIVKREYHIITNGFDEADIGIGFVEPDQKFSIAHIGSLAPSRNPVNLWKALESLKNEVPGFENDLEIKLVGKTDHSILNSIESTGLKKMTTLIDYLPHDKVVDIQQSARVLLLIINNSPNSKAILTGKIFEYLAARRPILCVGPTDGDAAEIIKQTESGVSAGFDDFDGIKKEIFKYYSQFRNHLLSNQNQEIQGYSRHSLTEKLVGILNL